MRIAVTRPAEDAAPFAAALRNLGVEPVLEPLMVIENIGGVILNLASYQALLITSANGVRAMIACTTERNIRVFAVGDASAQAARKAGFQNVESAAGNVETLAQLVADHLTPAGGPLLHVAGTRVAGDLAGQLGQEGFEVRREVLYRAQFAEHLSSEFVQELEAGNIDVITFTSSSTVKNFLALTGDKLLPAIRKVKTACIGPVTANTAREAGLNVEILPEQYTVSSLLDAIEAFFQSDS